MLVARIHYFDLHIIDNIASKTSTGIMSLILMLMKICMRQVKKLKLG